MKKDKIYTMSFPEDLCLELLASLFTPVTPDNFEESMKQMKELTDKLNNYKQQNPDH